MPSVVYLKKHAARTAAHRLARKRKRETERKRETQARQKWAHKTAAPPAQRQDFATAIAKARIARRLRKLAPEVRRMLRRDLGDAGWSIDLRNNVFHVQIAGVTYAIKVEPFGIPQPKVFLGAMELGDLADWRPGAGWVKVVPSDPATFERHMLSGQAEASELGDGT